MNVRYLVLFFSVISARDRIREYFIHRLVPNFQTLTIFCLFVQIQQNQRPPLRYDLHFPVKQLKHVFESLKLELDQICI